MKPLIVGEAPNRSGSYRTPCEGRVGRRLAACCGLSFDDYLRRFERTNVFARPPARWRIAVARRRAWRLVRGRFGDRVVVVLGRRAAAAFGLFDYFVWTRVGRARVTVVPHPSGRNRYWNDPARVARAARFMRRIGRRGRRRATSRAGRAVR